MSNIKRVFITGGAGGLGRALAFRYVRAGWHVCICHSAFTVSYFNAASVD